MNRSTRRLFGLSVMALSLSACEQPVGGGCCVIWSEVRVEAESLEGSPLGGARVIYQPIMRSNPTGLVPLELETDEMGMASHQWSLEYGSFERLGIIVEAPAGIDAPPVGDTIDMVWATRDEELPVTTLTFVLDSPP